MAMHDNDNCLTRGDLVSIERMLGHTLPGSIKGYLIGHYGPGSDYQKHRRKAKKAMQACIFRDSLVTEACQGCKACDFEGKDTLFVRVFRIIHCYEAGTFNVWMNDYDDACDNLVFYGASNKNPLGFY